MTTIPTKQLTRAFNYCNKDNNSHSYQFAHFQLDKSVYESGTPIVWNLYHYGTWILTIRIHDLGFNGKKVIVENGHGYSNTDRDNINGLISLLDIYGVKCRKINGIFHYDVMNPRVWIY